MVVPTASGEGDNVVDGVKHSEKVIHLLAMRKKLRLALPI